jgi:hypothetical protein
MVRLLEQRPADRRLTFSHHCLSVSIDPLDKADAPLIPEAYISPWGAMPLLTF